MLSDEEIDFAEQNYDRLVASKTKALLDEIARLREENDLLRAGRLRAETVRALRKTLLNCGDWNAGAESLADLGRCYPPEEV